ncbi:MAG: S-methyl-5-thioribose kinase [Chloroflexota bacterium]
MIDTSEYVALNEETVLEYVRSREELASRFKPDDTLTAEEVGDGNLNLVFKIYAEQDRSRTMVVKQALPYVRLVGESWPLPTDRARIEAQALAMHYKLCPEHTPEQYLFDPVMYLTAMRNLDDHIILRKGLSQGIKYPHIAEHIGTFMARTLGSTSDLVMAYDEKKEQVAKFINPELCKITEDLVFTDPYREDDGNAFHEEIRPQVEALQANEALRVEVAKMKEKFMTQAQALIHGDLHTGSIMVNQVDTYVIDPEFAFYGPMAFDIGAVIANLFLNYAAQEGRMDDDAQRKDFQEYLKQVVIDLWHVFVREFEPVWQQADPINMPQAYRDDYMLRLLQNAAGMGACKMMRRVIGLAGVEDIRGIEDVEKKSIAASMALNMAQKMLFQRNSFTTIEQLVEVVTDTTPTYPWQG